jgi:hypothetical protein
MNDVRSAGTGDQAEAGFEEFLGVVVDVVAIVVRNAAAVRRPEP